jgi:hypothetical protein
MLNESIPNILFILKAGKSSIPLKLFIFCAKNTIGLLEMSILDNIYLGIGGDIFYAN